MPDCAFGRGVVGDERLCREPAGHGFAAPNRAGLVGHPRKVMALRARCGRPRSLAVQLSADAESEGDRHRGERTHHQKR